MAVLQPSLNQPWRIAVVGAVSGFLALGLATHTFKAYHLGLLVAVPAALLAADTGRRFFVEWGPLMCTWLAYDRLRLVQPFLLERVAVRGPLAVECALFGWLAGRKLDAPDCGQKKTLAETGEGRIGVTITGTMRPAAIGHNVRALRSSNGVRKLPQAVAPCPVPGCQRADPSTRRG